MGIKSGAKIRTILWQTFCQCVVYEGGTSTYDISIYENAQAVFFDMGTELRSIPTHLVTFSQMIDWWVVTRLKPLLADKDIIMIFDNYILHPAEKHKLQRQRDDNQEYCNADLDFIPEPTTDSKYWGPFLSLRKTSCIVQCLLLCRILHTWKDMKKDKRLFVAGPQCTSTLPEFIPKEFYDGSTFEITDKIVHLTHDGLGEADVRIPATLKYCQSYLQCGWNAVVVKSTDLDMLPIFLLQERAGCNVFLHLSKLRLLNAKTPAHYAIDIDMLKTYYLHNSKTIITSMAFVLATHGTDYNEGIGGISSDSQLFRHWINDVVNNKHTKFIYMFDRKHYKLFSNIYAIVNSTIDKLNVSNRAKKFIQIGFTLNNIIDDSLKTVLYWKNLKFN